MYKMPNPPLLNEKSPMSIDQFLAEIADIKFVWFGDAIRTLKTALCPICALAAKKEPYPTINNAQWSRAANYLGLSDYDAAVIITAADRAININLAVDANVKMVRQRFTKMMVEQPYTD